MQQSMLSDSHRDFLTSGRPDEQHQRFLGLVEAANRGSLVGLPPLHPSLREDLFERGSHFSGADVRRTDSDEKANFDFRMRASEKLMQNFGSKDPLGNRTVSLSPNPQMLPPSSSSSKNNLNNNNNMPTSLMSPGGSSTASSSSSPSALPPQGMGQGGMSGVPPLDNIRRYRTAFTREQIGRLEKEFLKENYISRPKRCELAAELNLPENTIKVWFQNRRMKDKRQKMTLSWPCGDPVLAAYVLQAAAASGQLPYPGLFAAAAAASSHFGLLPPRPPPFGAPVPCRPPPTSPPGLFGPLMPHHSHLGGMGQEFVGLTDRQSPPRFPGGNLNGFSRDISPENQTSQISINGFSRDVSPPAQTSPCAEADRLSPKSAKEIYLTDLKSSSKDSSSSSRQASLFQPYLDVDKK